MPATELFELSASSSVATYLAEVVAVDDRAGLSRVQIRIHAFDGEADHDAPMWARVAVPFAGAGRGAFFLPDVGDEVLVSFVGGDTRLPIVLGSLWNGADSPPETLGGSGAAVDRWTIVGKAGTRIAIIEESPGAEKISLTTPGGQRILIDDSAGGKVEIFAAGNTVTMKPAGVSIETAGKVEIKASEVDVTAGMVKVDSALSKFSGVVQCDVLIATTVVGSTYTPGAGNIW